MLWSGADVSGSLKAGKEPRICDAKVIVTVKGTILITPAFKGKKSEVVKKDAVRASLRTACHGAVSGSEGGSKISFSIIRHN